MIRRLLASLCAAILMIGTGCARAVPKGPVAQPVKGPLAEYFNLNGIKPYHDKVGNQEVWTDLTKRLEMAKSLGTHGMRVDMWWGVIEPSKGSFEFEFPDRVMDQIVAAGLEPYPIFCYNAQWLKHSPQTQEEREDFGRYVHALVSRYKNHTKYWEVWNEPNITPFWVPEPNPELYTKLLEVSYKQAKAADPEAVIVGICTAGPDYRFIESVYRLGGGDFLDAVSFHHYDSRPSEKYLENEIITIQRIMRRYGDGDKPLFITELGYSTGKSDVSGEVNQEEQAAWIVKKHLISLAQGVDRFYYFKMIDDSPQESPDGFWGLFDWNLNPKPSRDAYVAMVDRLKPAEFLGRAVGVELPRGAGDAEVQLYKTGDEYLAVAWMRDNGSKGKIRLPADGEVIVENLYGRKIKSMMAEGGFVGVELGKDPVYIRGLSRGVVALVNVRFDPPSLAISPGETREVQLTLENPLNRPITVDFEPLMNTPPRSGVNIEAPAKVDLAAGKSMSVTAKVSMKADAPPFTVMNVRHGDGETFSYEYRVFHQPALDVKASVSELKGTDAVVVSRFQNLMMETASVQPGWIVDGVELPVRRGLLEAAPGEFAETTIPIKIKSGETEVVSVITASSGAESRDAMRLWGQPWRENGMKIDGDLADWEGVPSIRLTPEKHQAKPKPSMKAYTSRDLTADVYACWTNSHLYLAAKVTDPTPLVNPHEGTEIWRGDSLEFYIGFPGPTTKTIYGPGYFQLGITPGDNGSDPYVWNWKPSNPANDEEKQHGRRASQAEVVSRRTVAGYVVEAAIPLEEFEQRIAPMQALAFDVHVNNRSDRSAEQSELSLIWNGTDQNWRDPSNWGAAVVLP